MCIILYKWSIIATQLLGRTYNDIKNYWNTRLNKNLLGNRKDNQTCSFKEAKNMGLEIDHIRIPIDYYYSP